MSQEQEQEQETPVNPSSDNAAILSEKTDDSGENVKEGKDLKHLSIRIPLETSSIIDKRYKNNAKQAIIDSVAFFDCYADQEPLIKELIKYTKELDKVSNSITGMMSNAYVEQSSWIKEQYAEFLKEQSTQMAAVYNPSLATLRDHINQQLSEMETYKQQIIDNNEKLTQTTVKQLLTYSQKIDVQLASFNHQVETETKKMVNTFADTTILVSKMSDYIKNVSTESEHYESLLRKVQNHVSRFSSQLDSEVSSVQHKLYQNELKLQKMKKVAYLAAVVFAIIFSITHATTFYYFYSHSQKASVADVPPQRR